MANLKDLASRVRDIFFSSQPVQNFKGAVQQAKPFVQKQLMSNPLAGNGNVQKTFMPIAKTLQKTPQFNPSPTYQKVATGMPALMLPQMVAAQLKSYGTTLENVITPQGRKTLKEGFNFLKENPSQIVRHPGQTLMNPSVQATLDLSDFVPGGLIFGGLKALGKRGFREASEQAVRKGVLKEIQEQAVKSQKVKIVNKSSKVAQGGVDDLVKEARKYKSAEEFVRAQGTPVYHGTSEGTKINQFNLDKANWGVGSNAFAQGNKGIYLTDDIGSARYFSRKANEFKTLMEETPRGMIQAKHDKAWEYLFGKNASKGENVLDVVIDKGTRIKELNYYPSKFEIDEIIKSGKYDAVRFPELGMKNVEDLPKELWDKVKDSKTTFVFNLDKIKAKSQLTDIWNKANSQPAQGGVSIKPTEATLKRIKVRDIKAEEQAAKQSYKEWQSALFKQEAPRTTMGAVKDAAQSLKKTIKSPLSDVDNMRDISGFQGASRDVYRNFKHVFGKNFQKAKEIVLDPFNRAKGEFIDVQKQWVDDLSKNIIERLGIKKGSKLSELTQLYGEKQIDEKKLRQLAPNDWNKVIEADQWFRNAYNTLLDEINAVRKRIYPTDPTKIIPRREDYYRHFRELEEGYKGLFNIFETPAGISSKLSGISEFTRPKSKWLSVAQKRLGVETDVDAVGGFLDYIKQYAYATKIDPQASSFRNLADELGEVTSEGLNAGKLNNFIEYLHDFANDLTGKTNPLDRAAQKWIPGGRKTFRALNWLNSRVKANVILGNLSSSIAQIFNVPQGIAEVGLKNSTMGLVDSLVSIFRKNKVMAKSSFIKERYASQIYNQFDSGLLQNGKKFAAWITGVLDEVGTKYIWNSAYRKAVANGMSDAVGYADDITRRMVAGRGVGEVPLIQKSKVFQLFAPFQLEVGNLWWVMKDWVSEKEFGKLATFFIASYIFNQGAKKIRGSDVSFDPINATLEALDTYGEEENKKLGTLKFGGRLAGEVLSNIPLGQSAAAAYPEYGLQIGGQDLPTRKELFGEGDPTRFGSGLLFYKGLQDPLYKIFPPYAGQQIKRTIEGLSATNKGYSESKTGLVQYPISKNPLNFVRSATFGKNSTPEAQQYFKNDERPLGENQSALLKESTDKSSLYSQIMSARDVSAQEDKIRENVRQTGGSSANEEKVFYYDDGEVKSVLINREIQSPTLTGSKSLDKEKISKYSGEITSRINDIVKLVELGYMNEANAEQEITDLERKQKLAKLGRVESSKVLGSSDDPFALIEKYFPPEEWETAKAVMMAESGGQNIPSGFNQYGTEDSHGLFQINLNAHPQMRDKVYIPEENVKYAAQLWREQGWQPWGAYTSGNYRQYLGSSNSALQKKIISQQANEITSQINDIIDLYELGEISAQDANAQITALQAKQKALRASIKTFKPKKVTIKQTKIGSVKVSKISKSKLPSITLKKTPKVKVTTKKPNITIETYKAPTVKFKPIKGLTNAVKIV